MKLKLTLLFLSTVLFISCSKTEENKTPKTFRFLEFDQEAYLQMIQPGEISFLALDFDTNLSNWDLSLESEIGKINCSISRIEQTGNGYLNTESRAQRIYVKVPALEVSTYTLTLKNKMSNQIYTDTFLVTAGLFDNITHKSITSYNFSGDLTSNNIVFFQNASYVIENLLNTSGIQSVSLENRDTFASSSIEYSVVNGKVNFKIPTAITPGTYFLAVKYNSGITSYFKYDLLVVEEKKPIITSVNKTILSSGESLIIQGTNLKYILSEDLLPTKGLINVRVPINLKFTNFKGTGYVEYGRYETEPYFNKINSTATQLIFDIPTKSSAFYFNDYPSNTYFEGTITIESGPYESAPINVRFNYN